MKKVAMLTTFHGYLESYSLCQVARTQLKMLAENNYEVRFIFRGGEKGAWQTFTDDIALIPDYICDNDGNARGQEERSGKSFAEMTQETEEALETALADVDVIITHDLIYQAGNNIQDAAASLYAEKHPEKLWLHWIHSATSPRDLNKEVRGKYRNAFICYPNSYDVPRVAANFGYEQPDVKVVPHAMDYVEFFDMHELTARLIKEKDLLQADALCIYPLRLDRGKQPEVMLQIMNQMKRHCKKTIRVVIIDFQSTGGDKAAYRDQMKAWAAKRGWSSDELTFMSEFHESCNLQTPKKIVRDLFLLANVYIHPSKSETYSLTTQEAIACGNMVCLNFDFPAMFSIYGDGPLYKKFSSAVNMLTGEDGATETKYQDRDGYMQDVAKALAYHLENQETLKMRTRIRKYRNIQYIFKRYIEPLFYAVNTEGSL